MAEMNTDGGGSHKKKGSKPQRKKKSTSVDFTPMVDLGFLLITFFMLTTTMSKPSAMEITVPVKDKTEDNQTKIPASSAMTIILSENDKIYYYMGLPDTVPDLMVTDFSNEGIRKLLLEKNAPQLKKIEVLKAQLVNKEIADSTFKRKVSETLADKNALTVLVKLDDKASYKNLVDMMDELQICSVSKQALVEVQKEELAKIEAMKTPL